MASGHARVRGDGLQPRKPETPSPSSFLLHQQPYVAVMKTLPQGGLATEPRAPTLTRQQEGGQSPGPEEVPCVPRHAHPSPPGPLTFLLPATGTVPCPLR